MVMKWMLPLFPSTAMGWVLFSPVVRTVGTDHYESANGVRWANSDSFNLEAVSLRWGLPPSSYGDAELGSGISFALHRDFCARILPLFPEETGFGSLFLDCEDLRDTVKRSMDTWAINHKKINFIDVTELCRDVVDVQSCPHAELFIVPDDLARSDSATNDVAAEVVHDLTDIDFKPYTTAGFRLDQGLGVRRSRMVVRAPASASTFCWYLDSTFCYSFHRWQHESIDVILIGRIVCAAIFGLAALVFLWVLGSMVHAVCCETNLPPEMKSTRMQGSQNALNMLHSIGTEQSGQRSTSVVNLQQALQAAGQRPDTRSGRAETQLACGSRRCTNLMDYISVMPTIVLLLSIFWIIFAPIFYFFVFEPCYQCYDFEARPPHSLLAPPSGLLLHMALVGCTSPALFSHIRCPLIAIHGRLRSHTRWVTCSASTIQTPSGSSTSTPIGRWGATRANTLSTTCTSIRRNATVRA